MYLVGFSRGSFHAENGWLGQESDLHPFATKNSIIRNLMSKFLTSGWVVVGWLGMICEEKRAHSTNMHPPTRNISVLNILNIMSTPG